MIGEIKRINSDRGFGFIGAKDSADVFFHFRDLVGVALHELKQGDRVEFGVTQTDRGPKATAVRKAGQ